MEDWTLLDSFGSQRSFSTDINARAFDDYDPPPSLRSGVPSPVFDTTAPHRSLTWSVALGYHPSLAAAGTDWLNVMNFPTLFTLPAMSRPIDSDVLHRFSPAPTLPPLLGGELVSSPKCIVQGFATLPEEDSSEPHSSFVLHACSHEAMPAATHCARVLEHDNFGTSRSVPLTNAGAVVRKYTAKSQRRPSSTVLVIYEPGYRLARGNLGIRDIVEYDQVAFPRKTFKQKASFRLEVDGYKSYASQLNVNVKGGPPSRGRLAEVTIKFMKQFIAKCDEDGKPFPYKLDDLILTSIELVSEASVQPSFVVQIL
ncbi:hypothetical protein GSI_10086 [Ganoderma sinense ZZ0214-1]|uniref:Uncharacterized protein n=1 Tax=Ganoderma sinense ZZ0214-1 TaxID=1077348 RepID=A0A2G8S067_9APHY|nr:hypothetical protein GSI_10086 [Ganoderma sinense ZZ0214-1]